MDPTPYQTISCFVLAGSPERLVPVVLVALNPALILTDHDGSFLVDALGIAIVAL